MIIYDYISGWWFGTFLFLFHILGMSSFQLTFLFFRGVGQPPTRYTIIHDESFPLWIISKYYYISIMNLPTGFIIVWIYIYIYTSSPHNFQSSPSNSSHREPSNLGCQGKPARAPVDELQAPCCKGDRIYQYSNIILYCIILYYIILYYIIILYCIILYYIILYKWEMLVEDLEQKHDF